MQELPHKQGEQKPKGHNTTVDDLTNNHNTYYDDVE